MVFPKTSLARVREHLESLSDITVVRVLDSGFSRQVGYNHLVNFWVAHTKQPLYSPDELNSFMRSLIPPGLEYKEIQDFHITGVRGEKRMLQLGRIFFVEGIGHESTTRLCTITDSTLENVKGFDNNRMVINENRAYIRRISICPFPSLRIAYEVARGAMSSSCIPCEVLDKYRVAA